MREARWDLLHMVRDQHDRGSVRIRRQVGQRCDQILTATQVQASCRFVQKQQVRLDHQGPCQQDPLALT